MRKALKRMKNGEAVGPDDVTVEATSMSLNTQVQPSRVTGNLVKRRRREQTGGAGGEECQQ